MYVVEAVWKRIPNSRSSKMKGAFTGRLEINMLCYVILWYVMLCYVMLCYVMLCYVMLCYVMLYYVMLCYVMLCYVMLCYVMLCYVMRDVIVMQFLAFILMHKSNCDFLFGDNKDLNE